MVPQDLFKGPKVLRAALQYRIVEVQGSEQFRRRDQVAEIGHEEWRVSQSQVVEALEAGAQRPQKLAPAEGVQAIEEVALESHAADRVVPLEGLQKDGDVVVPEVLDAGKYFFDLLGEFENRKTVAFDLVQKNMVTMILLLTVVILLIHTHS